MLVKVHIHCHECGASEVREIDDSFQVVPANCSSCEDSEQRGYDYEDDPFYSDGNIRELDFDKE